jgi:outer membrane protein OmpA-like peptidoglycan-associated protein
VGGGLQIQYSRDRLDLNKHTLEFQASKRVASANVTVIADDGHELGRGSASYPNGASGWLQVGWTQQPGTVLHIDLRVQAADGSANAVRLTPWSVEVPHDEVEFDSGKSDIRPSESPKLERSLASIQKAIGEVAKADPAFSPRLYIAGHTDTVGGSDKNRQLSRDRAQAIAQYFRQKGVKIAIYYAGFGEDKLKVQTADETDEPKNRRADYILGAAEPRGWKGSWKSLP